MPKFSIITPINIWNQERLDKFLKTIESVENQSFKDFEWVIVDDGSTMAFDWNALALNSKIPSIVILHVQHGERVIAYNHAFKVAKGEWFTFLDSDDEYKPNYLERIDGYIKKFPKFKMFNFGAAYLHKDGVITFRDPFTPRVKGKGHEVFGGGNIVNGTYVFHREVYEALGGFPGDENGWVNNVDCTELNYGADQPRDLYMGTPYDFSAAAQLEFPQIREYFLVDHVNEPNKIIKELGNPWGQDFYLFYKYTRQFQSKVIKEHLYLVHPK